MNTKKQILNDGIAEQLLFVRVIENQLLKNGLSVYSSGNNCGVTATDNPQPCRFSAVGRRTDGG